MKHFIQSIATIVVIVLAAASLCACNKSEVEAEKAKLELARVKKILIRCFCLLESSVN
jgi:hypothetical protein